VVGQRDDLEHILVLQIVVMLQVVEQRFFVTNKVVVL
jgi:hypothetical protein